jgi:hypothetical protein
MKIRSFNAALAIQHMLIVVPQSFIDLRRTEALKEYPDGPHPEPFLVAANKLHPTDDDAFCAAILKNGMKVTLRHNMAELFGSTGLGLTASPAMIGVVPRSEESASRVADHEDIVAAMHEAPVYVPAGRQQTPGFGAAALADVTPPAPAPLQLGYTTSVVDEAESYGEGPSIETAEPGL